MTNRKKLTLILTTGLALTSSFAFSGSTEDAFDYYCQYCFQIPMPNPMCIAAIEVPDVVTFCGSESWTRSGVPECKRFERIEHPCANGTIIVYTKERWFGAGSHCSPGAFGGAGKDCY